MSTRPSHCGGRRRVQVIFVNPSVPATNMAEFINYARANPGKLNYGSPGSGTIPHLAIELLMQRTGINLVHVPFHGSPPAMEALLANTVQVFAVGLSAGAGHLKAGTIRALAVTSEKRLPGAPSIPTVSESGYPGFVASNSWILAAPAGTDQQILTRLATAASESLMNLDVRKIYSDNGFIAIGNSPSEIARDLAGEAKQWRELIAARGINSD